jgi:hypothetical protein
LERVIGLLYRGGYAMGKVKDLSIEFSPLIKVWKAKDGEFDATISNNQLPEYVASKLTRK